MYGLDVKVEPQPFAIHLIHDEPFVAGIKATVTFDPEIVAEEIINCGWLVGKSMPAKGPMKDVETSWRFSRPLPPYLEMHPDSDIRSVGSEGLKNTTNEDGVSMFLIRPNYCTDKQGRILGQELYGDRERPSPDSLELRADADDDDRSRRAVSLPVRIKVYGQRSVRRCLAFS